MRDPNPLVGGRGIARLQAAGVEVIEGLGEAEAKKLNEAFAKYIRHKLPFVTLKTAMTLDGKIAPPPARVEYALGAWVRLPRAAAGSPARLPVRMCTRCGMPTTPSWSAWAR